MTAFSIRRHLQSQGVALPPARPKSADRNDTDFVLMEIADAVAEGAGVGGSGKTGADALLIRTLTNLCQVARRSGTADREITGAVAQGFADAKTSRPQGPVRRGDLSGLVRAAARRLALDGFKIGRVTEATRGRVIDL